MDSKNGGQTFSATDDSKEKQRQTAAEIARKKVIAAYNSDADKIVKSKSISRKFSVGTNPSFTGASTTMRTGVTTRPTTGAVARSSAIMGTGATVSTAAPNTASYKQTPINANVTQQKDVAEEWKKYHSAWQGYYQKYYSEYYAKAAHDYIETEKLKAERERQDWARKEEGERGKGVSEPILIQDNQANDPTDEEEQGIMDTLRQTVREKAVRQTKMSRKVKRFVPIIAGVTVVLLILFLQYNRLIFAPIMAYVSPGNTSDDGITALDPTVTTAVGADNRLMIPKLNVDVPVNFGIPNDDDSINAAMENGVAQFAIPGASAMPGEIGNLVITGHSAGDIYSNNQYKFIFSGLERLSTGDLIYIDYQGTRYTYSATGFQTVEPSDVAALVYETSKPMLTLITCTPLGTARYRLLVSAEQINPTPTGVVQSEYVDDGSSEGAGEVMPQNEPTFFERIWNFLTGNN